MVKNLASGRSVTPAWAIAGLLCVLALNGCTQVQQWQSQLQPDPAERLAAAQAAYDSAQYQDAYQQAARITRAGGPDTHTAAYIAGMSAVRLNQPQSASQYLRVAARSDDRQLATDAKANLGLIYAQLGRHDLAAATLIEAAGQLSGQDRANAYYYAALSEQKLGRWPQARTNLTLARAHSGDPEFRQRVDEQLNVTGFTIQVGAFTDRDNAGTAARELAAKASELRLGQPRLQEAATAQGQAIVLVQIGQFHSYFTAEMFRRRLDVAEAIIVPLSGAAQP